MQRNGNMTILRENQQPIENYFELAPDVWFGRVFKATVIKMFKEWNRMMITQQTAILNEELKIIKENHVGILS